MKSLKLRDYQEQIVDELKVLDSSALYMGTGTGKTITALELVLTYNARHLLVVCPHNAIGQWKKTVRDYYNNYNIIEFKKSWSSKKINEYLLTIDYSKRVLIVLNYEMIHLIDNFKILVNEDWVIILDEIHRIKNYGTPRKPVKITHYLLALGELTNYKLGLTATPTQGNYGGYIEYYPQLKFLGYTDLSFKDFYDKYVVYSLERVGNVSFPMKVIRGYKNKNEIDELLQLVARRYVPKYKDFEPQFNDIILERSKAYPRMVREKAYKNAAINNSARMRIAKQTIATGVVSGKTMLRENVYYEDNTIKRDWLKDFLSDVDGKVVILYNYNVELDTLERLLKSMKKKYITINGQTKDKEAELRKEFDVVLGQYKAISEALDGLQYLSNKMVFFSMPSDSILYKQALGRIDRIGQDKVPMYYFLIMEKTIDEDIYSMIKEKVDFSEKTLNLLNLGDDNV